MKARALQMWQHGLNLPRYLRCNLHMPFDLKRRMGSYFKGPRSLPRQNTFDTQGQFAGERTRVQVAG